MRSHPMPSTVIRCWSYREETRELDVTFTTGRRYLYADVPPEAAQALKESFAKGVHFNRYIRGRYEYREVEPPSAERPMRERRG